MKLLFDQNISFRIVRLLKDHFSDCKHVSDVKLQNSKDFEIWQFAEKENFTIVTFDPDFYDLSMVRGFPPKIIWLRMGNILTAELADLMIKNKLAIEDFLALSESEIACLEIDTK
ncbi:DUF5615 family PIN-like protein [Flavobacterium sp.]|uniref:DUF5615 family PIN-like protein n=1 Tax=Flavobacterium sp. TaxID=239 RepID=UPI0012032D38|nr:DUF5615 family PIN-like protein [Flavobacterium sp.]RZJ71905.1 MAG: hypothetical protein EOO49_07705 [Flavobacterium sp.]